VLSTPRWFHRTPCNHRPRSCQPRGEPTIAGKQWELEAMPREFLGAGKPARREGHVSRQRSILRKDAGGICPLQALRRSACARGRRDGPQVTSRWAISDLRTEAATRCARGLRPCGACGGNAKDRQSSSGAIFHRAPGASRSSATNRPTIRRLENSRKSGRQGR